MSERTKSKVFISFCYEESSKQKDEIAKFIENEIISKSVKEGDIGDKLKDEEIRKIIRDDYLKDSTVTIVLVGEKTRGRKHVDWEIYTSMYDQKDGHTKSGILVIDITDKYWLNTPSIREKHYLSEGNTSTKESIEKNISHFPERLIKNILKDDVIIRIATYSEIINNKEYFLDLIDEAKKNRDSNNYDISDKMRGRNGR
ncbi:MAG: TIR domain-containing protein [Fusobacteriaceae bacterium]